MMCLSVDFFGFFSCLGFIQLFECIVLYLWPNFASFQTLFLRVIFSSCPLYSLLWDSNDMSVRNLRLFNFFQIISLCCSDWAISIVLSLGSLFFPLCSLHSAVEIIHGVLFPPFWLLHFLRFCSFHLVLSYIFHFLLRLSISYLGLYSFVSSM